MTRSKIRKPLFTLSSKAQVSHLLDVPPGVIGYVLSRIDRFYVRDERPKPGGGTRVLLKPRGRLIDIQARIKRAILDKVPPLPYVHGGISRRSIITNARPHVGAEVVLALDIKDCFPSIGPERSLTVFNELGITGEAARILVMLTTFQFQLPQGTKNSPALANLALRSIDRRLGALAAQYGCSYTRFVDDITISGGRRLLKFRRLVHRIVSSEGFALKNKKEPMLGSEPQVITKLLVNHKVNVTKDRRTAIRKEAFTPSANGQIEVPPSTMGKVRWLKSINPEVGTRLLARMAASSSKGADVAVGNSPDITVSDPQTSISDGK
ncbi:MAG: reverse transcriptase family protein [Nitrososphaerales archaeon]